MKKVLIIAGFMLVFAAPAMAQTSWVTGNQATFAWNAVAPIEPTDTITYQVYTKNTLSGTPIAFGATISGTQQLVQFTAEGRYFLCVQTLRLPQGESTPIPSERMACSDVATDTQSGIPFGVAYFAQPASAGGLRLAP
jgi:hypothetical protein